MELSTSPSRAARASNVTLHECHVTLFQNNKVSGLICFLWTATGTPWKIAFFPMPRAFALQLSPASASPLGLSETPQVLLVICETFCLNMSFHAWIQTTPSPIPFIINPIQNPSHRRNIYIGKSDCSSSSYSLHMPAWVLMSVCSLWINLLNGGILSLLSAFTPLRFYVGACREKWEQHVVYLGAFSLRP